MHWRRNAMPSLIVALLTLAACGPAPNAQGVGGVSRAQADALNQAAANLDHQTSEVNDAGATR